MKKKHIVTLVILNQKHEVLVQDRSTYSKYGEERSFFGGSIEEGELPIEAGIREAKEELDLDLQAQEMTYLGETEHVLEERGLIYHRHLFLIKTSRSEEEFTDYEGSGASFVSLDQLPLLKMNMDISLEIGLITAAIH